jgi:hypothetical protein
MDDPRRAEARRLRQQTRMSLAQLRHHFGVSRDTMAGWLWGLPTPEWTHRPNGKDDLRAQAVELRRDGCSVPDIAAKLKVSKSTAYLWTRHMPLDPMPELAVERRRRHMEEMRETRSGAGPAVPTVRRPPRRGTVGIAVPGEHPRVGRRRSSNEVVGRLGRRARPGVSTRHTQDTQPLDRPEQRRRVISRLPCYQRAPFAPSLLAGGRHHAGDRRRDAARRRRYDVSRGDDSMVMSALPSRVV